MDAGEEFTWTYLQRPRVLLPVVACGSDLNSATRKYFLRRLQGSHPCAPSACAASLPLLRKYTLSLRLKSCCLCQPTHLSVKRRQVTTKRGVSSMDAGEESIGIYLRRPRVLLPVVACGSDLNSATRKYFLRRLQGSRPCAPSACAASMPLLRKYTLSLRLKSCCYSSSFDTSLTAPLSALLASNA
jgi:hypothetical protein